MIDIQNARPVVITLTTGEQQILHIMLMTPEGSKYGNMDQAGMALP
jgi:hypothetical protein